VGKKAVVIGACTSGMSFSGKAFGSYLLFIILHAQAMILYKTFITMAWMSHCERSKKSISQFALITTVFIGTNDHLRTLFP
jgi:hypothetical protein